MQTQSETLSPARKAWITRRAKLAAAAAVIVSVPASGPLPGPGIVPKLESWQLPKPVIVTAPERIEPVTEFEMVTLFVDEAEGCGFHRFVVVGRSDRTVRLFHPSWLATIVVARKAFDKHARPAKRCHRKTVGEIIARNIRAAEKINDREMRDVLRTGGADGERALALATGSARQ